jgi:hypothetical protein
MTLHVVLAVLSATCSNRETSDVQAWLVDMHRGLDVIVDATPEFWDDARHHDFLLRIPTVPAGNSGLRCATTLGLISDGCQRELALSTLACLSHLSRLRTSFASLIMTCSVTSIHISTGILSSVATGRALTGDVSLGDCQPGSEEMDWLGSDPAAATHTGVIGELSFSTLRDTRRLLSSLAKGRDSPAGLLFPCCCRYCTRAEHSPHAIRSRQNLVFSKPPDTSRINSTAPPLFFAAVHREFFLPRNVCISHRGTRRSRWHSIILFLDSLTRVHHWLLWPWSVWEIGPGSLMYRGLLAGL